MNTRIIERKFKATDRMKEKIETKLSKFDKIFDSGARANVVLTDLKGSNICEITVYVGDTIFRVEEATDNMYASFDECIENLKKQIRKYKTRLENKFKNSGLHFEADNIVEEEEESAFQIVRSKTVSVKPMFVEEAILQMNLLGHQFFVFTNAETNDVNIVYKRKNSGYGLIETR